MANKNEDHRFTGEITNNSGATSLVEQNVWRDLKKFTAARIALGRVGNSLPTREILAFDMAHAMARDAVHIPLDLSSLLGEIHKRGWETECVKSQVKDRHSYLLRPDLGRRLSEDSKRSWHDAKPKTPIDFLIVVGDGLSSSAIANHAVPMIEAIKSHFPSEWNMGPIVCAVQARVAIADEIASLWKVPMVAILIGERPGLSSPDSLGIYFTFNPSLDSTDADRNCISNIRQQGLSYEAAAKKLIWLAKQSAIVKYSGVRLKDESDISLIEEK